MKTAAAEKTATKTATKNAPKKGARAKAPPGPAATPARPPATAAPRGHVTEETPLSELESILSRNGCTLNLVFDGRLFCATVTPVGHAQIAVSQGFATRMESTAIREWRATMAGAVNAALRRAGCLGKSYTPDSPALRAGSSSLRCHYTEGEGT